MIIAQGAPRFSALRVMTRGKSAAIDLLDSRHPLWGANQVILNGNVIGFSREVRIASERQSQGLTQTERSMPVTLKRLLDPYLHNPKFPGTARQTIVQALEWGHFDEIRHGFRQWYGEWLRTEKN